MTAADPDGIYNWKRLGPKLTTSGQLNETELEAIRALGVGTVVNLALGSHPKSLADEAGIVRALGMRYVHIPVEFTAPTQQDFDRFCAAVADAGEAPLHVHCIANYRVSAFFYRYRRDVLGMEEAAARADMESLWQPDAVWQAFITPAAASPAGHPAG